jgi:hypothetical protein
MNLRATWSIRDDGGHLIAHGVHSFAVDGTRPRAADPYEPALAIAGSIETALINFLPLGACRIVAHDPDRAVAFAVNAQ